MRIFGKQDLTEMFGLTYLYILIIVESPITVTNQINVEFIITIMIMIRVPQCCTVIDNKSRVLSMEQSWNRRVNGATYTRAWRRGE